MSGITCSARVDSTDREHEHHQTHASFDPKSECDEYVQAFQAGNAQGEERDAGGENDVIKADVCNVAPCSCGASVDLNHNLCRGGFDYVCTIVLGEESCEPSSVCMRLLVDECLSPIRCAREE